MIIVDLLEGLIVPSISSPLNVILSWNKHKPKDIKTLFEFTDGFLNDVVPLLLFLP